MFVPNTKIIIKSSKWIDALNIRPETVKLLEEKTGDKFYNTGLDNDSLDLTLKAQATKLNIEK